MFCIKKNNQKSSIFLIQGKTRKIDKGGEGGKMATQAAGYVTQAVDCPPPTPTRGMTLRDLTAAFRGWRNRLTKIVNLPPVSLTPVVHLDL